MPAMTHTLQHFVGFILETFNGYGNDRSVVAEDAGTVPVVRIGGRGRVASDAPS